MRISPVNLYEKHVFASLALPGRCHVYHRKGRREEGSELFSSPGDKRKVGRPMGQSNSPHPSNLPAGEGTFCNTSIISQQRNE